MEVRGAIDANCYWCGTFEGNIFYPRRIPVVYRDFLWGFMEPLCGACVDWHYNGIDNPKGLSLIHI